MIDIHTHILPGVDDGAADIKDAMNMAQAAIREGITSIIATPHHANGTYMNPAHDVRKHVDELNRCLGNAGMPVRIVAGQEIRIHDDMLEAWSRQELLTLADSRYMLLEMPSSRIPKGMADLVHELAIMGVVPIIAHPERNAEAAAHPERLEELIELGAYGQVTSHSLLGGFGKRVEQTSWELLKRGCIGIVSSDAHHVERRGFRLGEAYAAIERTMGEQWVAYLKSNASHVLDDQPFGNRPPLRGAQSKGGIKKWMSALFNK
ncbi:tyrosine-protein phosphatase [Paenibacillus sp. strain BS8-2]